MNLTAPLSNAPLSNAPAAAPGACYALTPVPFAVGHRPGRPAPAEAGALCGGARRAGAMLLVLLLLLLLVASVVGLCGGVPAGAGAVSNGGSAAAPQGPVWCAGAAAGCGQRVAARVLAAEGLPGVGAPTAPSSDDDCRPGGLPGCDEILGEWDAVTPSRSRA